MLIYVIVLYITLFVYLCISLCSLCLCINVCVRAALPDLNKVDWIGLYQRFTSALSHFTILFTSLLPYLLASLLIAEIALLVLLHYKMR